MKYLSIILITLNLSIALAGCLNQAANNTNKIEINQQSDYTEVILKNKHITARYTSHNPSAMVNLYINNSMKDVAGGTIWQYLDGMESSGSIKYAQLVEKQDSLETVELIWENLSETHITIYKSLPVLKIDYYHAGSEKISDVGSTRGNHNGHIATYGYSKPSLNDSDSLLPIKDYKGYFIGGMVNNATGMGFGRIFPSDRLSEAVKIVANSGGLEYNVMGDENGYIPITSFIYTVANGEEELINMGKVIVDWHLKMSNKLISEKK
jgi:hypothetical protein